ncbi:MAG: hypothetical protein H7144_08075 [Burkholderiales bacterium]|nr:hypothetical protein [Phycisphaerae bacterium]
MKSEHRHELQTNSLAATMTNLPELLRKHSSKIMTVLAIVLLIVAAVRYRRNQVAEREEGVRIALATAWNTLTELQRMSPAPNPQRAKMIQDAEADIRGSVQKVLDEADPATDRSRLASAWQVSGDLYWLLANQPDAPSTTQPTTQSTQSPTTQSASSHLDRAEAAYTRIVSDYADQPIPATVARFGLAAIAENRRDWTKARQQYKALIEASGTAGASKAMAEKRISMLDNLQKPLLLLPPEAPVPALDLSNRQSGPFAPTFDIPLLGNSGTTPVPATAPSTAPSTTQP